VVAVLSQAALRRAEEELGAALELHAAGIDADGRSVAGATLAELLRLRQEVRRRRDTLGAARHAASRALAAAMASRAPDPAALHEALAAAQAACLQGDARRDGVGPGGPWIVREVRDARRALVAAERRAAEAAARAARRRALSHLRVRDEALGTDRWGRRHWRLGGGGGSGGGGSGGGDSGGGSGGGGGAGGGDDDGDAAVAGGAGSALVWAQPRSRERATAGGAVLAAPPPDARSDPHAWQLYVGRDACLGVAASLDARGARERALAATLLRSAAAGGR